MQKHISVTEFIKLNKLIDQSTSVPRLPNVDQAYEDPTPAAGNYRPMISHDTLKIAINDISSEAISPIGRIHTSSMFDVKKDTLPIIEDEKLSNTYKPQDSMRQVPDKNNSGVNLLSGTLNQWTLGDLGEDSLDPLRVEDSIENLKDSLMVKSISPFKNYNMDLYDSIKDRGKYPVK